MELITSKKCAPLCNYAASSGNFLPTFRDDLSDPTSRVKDKKGENGTRYVVPKRQ